MQKAYFENQGILPGTLVGDQNESMDPEPKSSPPREQERVRGLRTASTLLQLTDCNLSVLITPMRPVPFLE